MSSKIPIFKIWWLFGPSILGGVLNKFLDKIFRKMFWFFFCAKNKSFEQNTPAKTKNSQLQCIFKDFSSSLKNPHPQIFTHFRVSGEITKEMQHSNEFCLCSDYMPGLGLSSFSLRFDVPGVCKYLFLRLTKVKGVPWGPKVLIWRKKNFDVSKCHILKSTRYPTYVLKRQGSIHLLEG